MAWKGGSSELAVMCRQRERWHWRYGVGMNQARGWLVGGFLLLSHQKETQTTRQNNNNQTHRTETRSYAEGGCALRLLLRWHLAGLSQVPSLLRKKRSWSWVFAEIQAVSQRFCHVVSSCSQRAFLFFLQCVERSKFLYENLVYEEKSFPLVCLALSTKQQLDKRKVFFF